MKKQIINDKLDLACLPNTAVIRDSSGDVYERRGGEWCGYECAPLNNHQMAKHLPVTVLDNGHFPGRLAAASAALEQTAVVDGPMEPEDVARIALEAADGWEREEFGGRPTVELYHDPDDSEESLHSYIHDALLDLTNDDGEIIDRPLSTILDTVWDAIEERTVTE